MLVNPCACSLPSQKFNQHKVYHKSYEFYDSYGDHVKKNMDPIYLVNYKKMVDFKLAQENLNNVRSLLDEGAGNLISNMEITNFESSARVEIQQEIYNLLINQYLNHQEIPISVNPLVKIISSIFSFYLGSELMEYV